MLMKIEFKIFEIPVYYTSEDMHNKKWKKKKDDFINHQIYTGATKSEANNGFIKCYKYESTWKYHKIIGFISINYDFKSGDLKFHVYKTINKKNSYNSIFKLKFDEIYGVNLHEYVRNKTSQNIIVLMENKIKYIKKVLFNNKCYIDLDAFYIASKYICFEQLINDLDNIGK